MWGCLQGTKYIRFVTGVMKKKPVDMIRFRSPQYLQRRKLYPVLIRHLQIPDALKVTPATQVFAIRWRKLQTRRMLHDRCFGSIRNALQSSLLHRLLNRLLRGRLGFRTS